MGLEPMTSWMLIRRSTNWTTGPKFLRWFHHRWTTSIVKCILGLSHCGGVQNPNWTMHLNRWLSGIALFPSSAADIVLPAAWTRTILNNTIIIRAKDSSRTSFLWFSVTSIPTIGYDGIKSFNSPWRSNCSSHIVQRRGLLQAVAIDITDFTFIAVYFSVYWWKVLIDACWLKLHRSISNQASGGFEPTGST